MSMIFFKVPSFLQHGQPNIHKVPSNDLTSLQDESKIRIRLYTTTDNGTTKQSKTSSQQRRRQNTSSFSFSPSKDFELSHEQDVHTKKNNNDREALWLCLTITKKNDKHNIRSQPRE
jgi:hypothetical protein